MHVSKTLIEVDTHKRKHATLFHLYEVEELAKQIDGDRSQDR